jgi:outer membrane lipoprotein-sorting protein
MSRLRPSLDPRLRALLLALFFGFLSAQELKDLVVDFERTEQSRGTTESVKGTIYYQPPDRIMIHVTDPVDQWMDFESNALVIYYPVEQKAFRILAQYPFALPFFQAFVGVVKEDFGLAELGFTLDRNETRDETLITYWTPPGKAKKTMGPILVGMTEDRIAFMEMQNAKHRPIGRVTYTDYSDAGSLSLPLKVSARRYPGRDTTYEDVTYSNPQSDVELPEEVLNFRIPDSITVKEIHW